MRHGLELVPEFDRAESVTVQIEILKESYDKLKDVIVANEWEQEEGLRTVLLNGLGYLESDLQVKRINEAAFAANQAEAAKRMDTLVKDLAAYHSMYSVMKYKAFKYYKVNQVLEFNISGLRATERMWEGWAERTRRQQAELQAENLRLRALMSEFKLDWDTGGGQEAPAALPGPIPFTLEADDPVGADTVRLDQTVQETEPPKPGLWSRFWRWMPGMISPGGRRLSTYSQPCRW